MRERRNVGNPCPVTDRKREGIRFTLVWQGTYQQRWLPRNNVTPAITTRVFSLLHGQTRPHDVLGWAEELQSALIWVFSMIQPGQWLTMTSTWTLKFVSFFSSRQMLKYCTFMWAVRGRRRFYFRLIPSLTWKTLRENYTCPADAKLRFGFDATALKSEPAKPSRTETTQVKRFSRRGVWKVTVWMSEAFVILAARQDSTICPAVWATRRSDPFFFTFYFLSRTYTTNISLGRLETFTWIWSNKAASLSVSYE